MITREEMCNVVQKLDVENADWLVITDDSDWKYEFAEKLHEAIDTLAECKFLYHKALFVRLCKYYIKI